MKRLFCLAITLGLAGLLSPSARAQSDDSPSLGDLARSLRREKQAAAPAVIDNDNLTQVMDTAESHRLSASLLFSITGPKNSFQMSSPDGTCSLSFSANATALVSDTNLIEPLPPGELAKLEGPAVIDSDTLQISVFNGTDWQVREIVVGLTLVRPDESEADFYREARLLPAVTTQDPEDSAGKPSDTTLVLHLKAPAAPLMTTVFRQPLGTAIAPDQEWHWAILNAKGIPPTNSVPLPTP